MSPFRNIHSTFCISRQALSECVNEKTIETSLVRSTLKAVIPGWYVWDSVPRKWKPEVEARWCQGQDAEQYFNDQSKGARLLDMLPPIHPADVAILLGDQTSRERVKTTTGEVWNESRGALPLTERQSLLEATRWLSLVNTLEDRVCRGVLGINRKQTIERYLIPLLQERDVKLPLSYRRLLMRAEEYATIGASALIPGYYGNSNAAKIGDEQASLLVTLYCSPTKPTIDQTANAYNELASGMGWESVNLRTVRRHLRRPEIAQLWTLGREGLSEYRRLYGYTFTTQRPSQPDLLWMHDGTKVNYYYRDDNGNRAAGLNVVAVIDAHSFYILGWAFRTHAENSDMVREAVRMAVRHADGRLPMQYLYDGAGANVSFFKTWPGLHTTAQPNRGQSKSIESVFGQIQQYIMRRNTNFTGQNITASGQRGKLNKDKEAMDKVRDLPNLEEVMQMAELDFEIWNNSAHDSLDGKTPAEVYRAGNRIPGLVLTDDIDRECFWRLHRDQTGTPFRKRFEATRMRMDINKQQYYYEVNGPDGLPDETFYRLHQGTEFHVKYDPESPGTGLALYLPDGDRYLVTATDRFIAPRAIGDYEEGDAKKIRALLKYQTEQIRNNKETVADMMNSMKEALDAEELEKLGYMYVDKETLNRAEEALVLRNTKEQEPTPITPSVVEQPKTASPAPAPKPKRSAMDMINQFNEHYDD